MNSYNTKLHLPAIFAHAFEVGFRDRTLLACMVANGESNGAGKVGAFQLLLRCRGAGRKCFSIKKRIFNERGECSFT